MKTIGKFVTVLFLFVAVSGFSNLQAQEEAEESLKSMAEFENKTHDFGKIAQGVPVKAKYKVKNTSMVPLVITRVTTSCGCTVANYTKEPIKPGETGFVEAKFNASAMGHFSKTVHVFTNSAEPMIDVFLKGEVVPKSALEQEAKEE